MHFHAHAKVNIFLKIVGTRGHYHELLSRFMIVKDLYDTLCFVPKTNDESFELIGDFDCDLEHNTIYKIYVELHKAGFGEAIERVMRENALRVQKRIPSGAGLGGGSSDAAAFLKMLNAKASLGLSQEALMKIGERVGADVAFFVSGYESANVSGIGETVEKCDESALDLEVFTPELHCNTARVYQYFREYFLPSIEPKSAHEMLGLPSVELLRSYDKARLNDLFGACMKAYPQLGEYAKEGWFFSGSGSSFFRIKEPNG
jgi:4-diphosphocytidyl-2-C-methyl-D-erythritol kinase